MNSVRQFSMEFKFLHGHKLPYVVLEYGMLTRGIVGDLHTDLEKPNPYPVIGSVGYSLASRTG